MANAWKPEYTQEKFYTLFDGLDEGARFRNCKTLITIL